MAILGPADPPLFWAPKPLPDPCPKLIFVRNTMLISKWPFWEAGGLGGVQKRGRGGTHTYCIKNTIRAHFETPPVY